MPTSVPRALILFAALVACEQPVKREAAAPGAPRGKPMSLPDGRVIDVSFDRVPDRACASPEALKRYLESSYWSPGSKAEIESRKSLSDGFSTILSVRHGGALDRPVRELFVMRQLGNAWFGCNAVLTDESLHVPVVALCRSLPRPPDTK